MRVGSNDVGLALNYFAESAEHYMKAGMQYPEDDEKRIGESYRPPSSDIALGF